MTFVVVVLIKGHADSVPQVRPNESIVSVVPPGGSGAPVHVVVVVMDVMEVLI